MKKILIFCILILSAALAMGCTKTANNIPLENESIDLEEETSDENVSGGQCDLEGNCGDSDQNIKEFNMTASQYIYEPAEIVVKEGDKIKINIESTDVSHSFTMNDFNDTDGNAINVFLPANEKKMVEFVADKKGEFIFGCDVYCGIGHSKMLGKIVVL